MNAMTGLLEDKCTNHLSMKPYCAGAASAHELWRLKRVFFGHKIDENINKYVREQLFFQ
jgi:hypothetical protein